MSYLLRENLELFTGPQGAQIRCARCQHVFCGAGEDWKPASRVRLLPPTAAGPLMSGASGKYVLQQNTCPSCGVLLDTDLIEEKKDAKETKEQAPKKPEPVPVEVDRRTTAILVLDVSCVAAWRGGISRKGPRRRDLGRFLGLRITARDAHGESRVLASAQGERAGYLSRRLR
jgi:hypothetical protein